MMLLIFGGLPGTGKTTIARLLAKRIEAVYLRIDSIEQALVDSGVVPDASELRDAGYRAAYAVAADNLRMGRMVVADSVNPLEITRQAWRDVASRGCSGHLEIETVCTESEEHRRRVEQRVSDVPGLTLPTWRQVREREYQPWTTADMVIDTASLSPEAAVDLISEQVVLAESFPRIPPVSPPPRGRGK